MITGKELKQVAKEILPKALEEARLAWYQAGNRDGKWLSNAEEVIKDLIVDIDAPAPPNPRYSKMAELAAELVYMSWHHEDELSCTLGILKNDDCRKISIRDVKGLNRIYGFYKAVCDDHSYTLSALSDRPIITMDDFDVLVSPNSLLEELQKYRGELTADVGLKP